MNKPEKNRNTHPSLKRSLVIALIIAIACFYWGFLTMSEQIFPSEQIRAVTVFFVKPPTSLPANSGGQERRDQFKLFHTQADTVFLGDSITNAGNWTEIFPKFSVSNRGIAGDKTDDLLGILDAELLVQPKKAFIMIGTNDLGNGRSVEDTFINYQSIVEKLRKKNIQVFIQSTLECEAIKCTWRLGMIRELNEKLQQYAKAHDITYININTGLTTKEKGLLPEFTNDGIHILGNGYVIWSQKIIPYLR